MKSGVRPLVIFSQRPNIALLTLMRKTIGGDDLDFPTIHTNFWDVVLSIPVVMIVTQFLKIIFKIPKKFVPTTALILGLFISIFISHKGDIYAGIFMGFFYGYAAIGGYASLKTTILSYREERKNYE